MSDLDQLKQEIANAESLFVDSETRSRVDLKKCGHYAYAEDPSTDILLLPIAAGNGPVHCVDLTTTPAPDWLIEALTTKVFRAWGSFDYVVLNEKLLKPFGTRIEPKRFYDISAHAQALTFSRSLKQACSQLKIASEDRKLEIGKVLIKKFSFPDASGNFADPKDYPQDWAEFKRYAGGDVYSERACNRELDSIAKWSASEHQVYADMLRTNDYGLPLDAALIANASQALELIHAEVFAKFKALTKVDSFHKHAQIKRWCAKEGLTIDSIRESVICEYLKSETEIPENVRALFEIKQEQPKAAVAKFARLRSYKSSDNRLRGMFTYHRATTGRFSSVGPQVHNLSRPPKYLPGSEIKAAPGIDAEPPIKFPGAEITEALRTGWAAPDTDETAGAIYEGWRCPAPVGITEAINRGWLLPGIDPHLQLKSVIRSAFRAPDGKLLVVQDFSGIENRMLAYVANCQAILDVYRSGGSLYRKTAFDWFNAKTVEEADDLKPYTKVTILGGGYQMGAEKFQEYAKQFELNLTEGQSKTLIASFRNAFPEIVHAWSAIEEAVMRALKTKARVTVMGHIIDATDDRAMSIRLLSGRRIWYRNALIDKTAKRKGSGMRLEIRYDGAEEDGVAKRIGTYGGKLIENITQANCRDLLTDAVRRCFEAGFTVVGTVHDEIILEVDEPEAESVKGKLHDIMLAVPSWCSGLPMDAEGYINKFYRK